MRHTGGASLVAILMLLAACAGTPVANSPRPTDSPVRTAENTERPEHTAEPTAEPTDGTAGDVRESGFTDDQVVEFCDAQDVLAEAEHALTGPLAGLRNASDQTQAQQLAADYADALDEADAILGQIEAAGDASEAVTALRAYVAEANDLMDQVSEGDMPLDEVSQRAAALSEPRGEVMQLIYENPVLSQHISTGCADPAGTSESGPTPSGVVPPGDTPPPP